MNIPAMVLVFIIGTPLFACISFLSGNREVIEICNAVGLRPETHLSRLVKGRVLGLKQALLVQKDSEYGLVEINRESVPSSAWNLMFHSVRAKSFHTKNGTVTPPCSVVAGAGRRS